MASEAIAEEIEWPDADPAAGGPVRASERLVTLDFIRGIAVLGILVANIVGFSAPIAAYSWPGAYPQPMGAADRLVWLAQFLLVDGKFRGLFSLMFGASMMLFMERAWARGASRWPADDRPREGAAKRRPGPETARSAPQPALLAAVHAVVIMVAHLTA